ERQWGYDIGGETALTAPRAAGEHLFGNAAARQFRRISGDLLHYRRCFRYDRAVMRRPILPRGVFAYCDGRSGRRRARVDECWAVISAETAYDALVRDAPWKMHPGARGELLWTVDGRARGVRWELRPNRLWRHGRAFLRCSACDQRATRIYLPTA